MARPCPVCGSLDHPDPVEPTFEPVSRDQEDAANALADAASAEADKAGQEVAAADARIGDLAQRLAGAGFAALATTTARPCCGRPLQAAQADPVAAAARQADADAKRLEAEAADLAAQAATLPARQRELDALDDAIATGNARLAELTEQRKAARREADGRRRARAGRTAPSSAPSSAARSTWTPPSTPPAACRRIAVRRRRRGGRDRPHRRRGADGGRTRGPRSDRGGLRTAPAHGPGSAQHLAAVAAARAAMRDPAGAATRPTASAGTRPRPQPSPPSSPTPTWPSTSTRPRRSPRRPRGRGRPAGARRGRTARTPPPSDTAAQLAVLTPRLEDLLDRPGPAPERADQIRQLAELANGNGANQYRMTLSSFVLAARLEEVAQAASERLLTMTAGRYSLAHSDARKGNAKAGLSLLACDSWTGVDRDTATLSGGETFLASLALALGLADVVTAEAAGTPMEALFVDEGFGTLDEETLDEVMNVLDGLRAGGRIVGIVSHVTELRQRIPAQVHVAKGRHGSHVTVTVG